MDAFKQVWSRLIELNRRLSPNARLIAALSAVALIVCIGWTVRGLLVVETVYLLGPQTLTSEELTEMQTALAKAQLSDFAVEGNRIRVPRERQAAYIAALAENRALPESVPEMLSEAIDKVNWFTNVQQQADYKEAARLKGLTSILRSFEGVETAEVVFDKAESRSLRPERTMTALVAIKLRGGRPLDDERAAMFRSVLTAAIAGLTPQNVTVVDKATNRSHHYQADQVAGPGSRYRDSKRAYESQYEARVRDLLHHVPGVTVSAEVELESVSRHEAAAASTNQAGLSPGDAKSVTSTPEGAVVSHGAANQPLDLTSATAEPTTPLTPQPTPISDRPQAMTATRDPAAANLDTFVPRRVCLSIGVPMAYIENIWRQRLAAPSEQRAGAPAPDLETVQAQELANIRQLAAPLVQASSNDTDAVNRVAVTPLSTMVFDLATPPSLLATATGWLTSPWGPLTVVLTLIGGGWMARMLRVTPNQATDNPETHDLPAATARLRNSRMDEPSPARPTSAFHERIATTNSLRGELADMVREDPDVAANILRNWIGNSST